MFVGRELLLDDGSHSLNEPCESFFCDSTNGEIEGMGQVQTEWLNSFSQHSKLHPLI